ncbi:hypothetical protein K8I31_01690, partial [bacterium]|nr:hypothetical protein [bacterium]
MHERLEIIEQTRQNTQSRLMNERNALGVWEGQLSESALSTATAVIALATVAKSPRLFSQCNVNAESLIETARRGLQWLSDNQNSDGGWGDTIKSQSNISTTLLAWGAYAAVDDSQVEHKLALLLADEWIQDCIGGVDAESVSRAILAKYGKDKTFSVPILTALAIAGRLGPEDEAWRNVHPLPFELAMFPNQLYA